MKYRIELEYKLNVHHVDMNDYLIAKKNELSLLRYYYIFAEFYQVLLIVYEEKVLVYVAAPDVEKYM